MLPAGSGTVALTSHVASWCVHGRLCLVGSPSVASSCAVRGRLVVFVVVVVVAFDAFVAFVVLLLALYCLGLCAFVFSLVVLVLLVSSDLYVCCCGQGCPTFSSCFPLSRTISSRTLNLFLKSV